MKNLKNGLASVDELWKISDEKPVVLGITASWHSTADMLNIVFSKVAQDMAGEVEAYVIDVEENADLVNKLEVESIPSVVIVHKKNIERKLVGIKSKKDIIRTIQEVRNIAS